MRDKIIEHLMCYLPRHIATLLANEILVLFDEENTKEFDKYLESRYQAYKKQFGVDYAGIDPVKWGKVEVNQEWLDDCVIGVDWGKGEDRTVIREEECKHENLKCHMPFSIVVCKDCDKIVTKDDIDMNRFRFFEDNEGIVDTEIIK